MGDHAVLWTGQETRGKAWEAAWRMEPCGLVSGALESKGGSVGHREAQGCH